MSGEYIDADKLRIDGSIPAGDFVMDNLVFDTEGNLVPKSEDPEVGSAISGILGHVIASDVTDLLARIEECKDKPCVTGRYGCGSIGRACLESSKDAVCAIAVVEHGVRSPADIPRTVRVTN